MVQSARKLSMNATLTIANPTNNIIGKGHHNNDNIIIGLNFISLYKCITANSL